MVLVAKLLGGFFGCTGLAGSLVNGVRAPVCFAKDGDPILPFTSVPSADTSNDSIDFLTLLDSGELSSFIPSAISIVLGYKQKK